MKKRKSLRGLKKKAWAAWSKHIRSSAADFSGYAACITCGNRFQWKEMHAGHFHHGVLDFDKLNINPQCVKCNTYLHGNLGLYALKLIQRYGLPTVKSLEKRAHIERGSGKKYTAEELQQIIDKYK